jgi:N-acylneuraminate cytidylyltransferase/CMP-N,N'-diacetyllegionaminic acid synthase
MRICTICIRAGSKGVPGKNWRPINGLPLFVHTLNHANSSNQFDRIVISTDSPIVKKLAENLSVDLIIDRDEHLATDESGKVSAIVDAVIKSEKHFNEEYSTCVDLDVTSPLRIPEDIVGAINLMESSSSSSVITGSESRRSPYFNMVKLNEKGNVEICIPPQNLTLRRQDSPITYDMNASIYVWNRNKLIEERKVFFPETKIYVMPQERSLDIDTELDFEIVEHLMSKYGKT